MPISTSWINYWSDIPHSSDTGVKWESNGTIQQLFLDFEEVHDSVKWEILYNILTELGTTMKYVRLIKMCLNKSYGKVRMGRNLSDAFPIQNDLKQGDAIPPLLPTLL
jgi:hypothetical protein